jgi:hypothetical protein
MVLMIIIDSQKRFTISTTPADLVFIRTSSDSTKEHIVSNILPCSNVIRGVIGGDDDDGTKNTSQKRPSIF